MNRRLNPMEEWIMVVDCHLCKNETPTKESSIIQVPRTVLGINGFMNVRVCKECHRESQLNKLI
jgi:hypothetical protein